LIGIQPEKTNTKSQRYFFPSANEEYIYLNPMTPHSPPLSEEENDPVKSAKSNLKQSTHDELTAELDIYRFRCADLEVKFSLAILVYLS